MCPPALQRVWLPGPNGLWPVSIARTHGPLSPCADYAAWFLPTSGCNDHADSLSGEFGMLNVAQHLFMLRGKKINLFVPNRGVDGL